MRGRYRTARPATPRSNAKIRTGAPFAPSSLSGARSRSARARAADRDSLAFSTHHAAGREPSHGVSSQVVESTGSADGPSKPIRRDPELDQCSVPHQRRDTTSPSSRPPCRSCGHCRRRAQTTSPARTLCEQAAVSRASAAALPHRAGRLLPSDVDRSRAHRVTKPVERHVVEAVATCDLVRRGIDVGADVIEQVQLRHGVAVVLDARDRAERRRGEAGKDRHAVPEGMSQVRRLARADSSHARGLRRSAGAARCRAALPSRASRARARCRSGSGRDARTGSSRRRARARACRPPRSRRARRAASRSESLPASTWARSEPNGPLRHWPQSSTTSLSMMSVSESSTALIVPYGHHQRAGLDPLRPQQRLRPLEPRRLDDDVGAAHDRLPVVADAHRPPEVALELRAERLAALGPPRVHADLVELEQVGQQAHVPVGRAARADVAEHARVARASWRAPSARDRAGAHVGQARPRRSPPAARPCAGRRASAGRSRRAVRARSCRRSRRRP